MPDWMDRAQELELMANDARQAAARQPQVTPPFKRSCARCYEPIEQRRLQACPATTRCVDCEELEEVRCSQRRFMGRPIA